MQLLLEEFFRKVYGISKGGANSIMLILIIRVIIYGIFIFAVWFIIYAILKGLYIILLIIIGVIILGEVAHYIRKSREKILMNGCYQAVSKEHTQEVLSLEESKNDSLLKANKSKNSHLLFKNKKP